MSTPQRANGFRVAPDKTLSGTKPHMRRGGGETVQQWCTRLARSCYRCGQRHTDLVALSLHEDHCRAGPIPEHQTKLSDAPAVD